MAINDYKRTLLAVNKETNRPFDQPEDMEFLVYETTDNHVKLRVDGNEISGGGATKKQFIITQEIFDELDVEVESSTTTGAQLSVMGNLTDEQMALLMEADEIIFNNVSATIEGTTYNSYTKLEAGSYSTNSNKTQEIKIFGNSVYFMENHLSNYLMANSYSGNRVIIGSIQTFGVV